MSSSLRYGDGHVYARYFLRGNRITKKNKSDAAVHRISMEIVYRVDALPVSTGNLLYSASEIIAKDKQIQIFRIPTYNP
jgi:hypothetical protein